jgi:hypothetical protein
MCLTQNSAAVCPGSNIHRLIGRLGFPRGPETSSRTSRHSMSAELLSMGLSVAILISAKVACKANGDPLSLEFLDCACFVPEPGQNKRLPLSGETKEAASCGCPNLARIFCERTSKAGKI